MVFARMGVESVASSRLSVSEYVNGVLDSNRSILARAITLVESRAASDRHLAEQVLNTLLPKSGQARRIGITGVPGVGKSTFIDVFGTDLCERGKRVAVLTIDPSSQRSGGSILGDKTRMDRLSREPNAFIRPSPAGDTLGGVARKTRETMVLCEAAGFDVIIVESVGVGQSETALRSMVDFLALLMLPGAGDELQGIKRGIMELADVVFVNKADGLNKDRAEQAKQEYSLALRYMTTFNSSWKPEVMTGSALSGFGVRELWEMAERFYGELEPKGVIAQNRQFQQLEWLKDLVRDQIWERLFRQSDAKALWESMQKRIITGELIPPSAANLLVQQIFKQKA